MINSTLSSKIGICRAVAVAVVCFMTWVAVPAMRAQTPYYTITSTAGDTSGTCTNQAASGATLDANCTVYAAFAAVTALGSPSSTPTINFAPSLNGKTITMSTSVAVTGNVTLVGPESGANAITLNGNSTFFGGTGGSTGGFLTQNGSTSNTTIYGLTLTKFANSGNGGAFSQPSGTGTLSLINDTFTQNASQGGLGGAAYVPNGVVSVSGSTFIQNTVISTASLQGGGAIYAPNVTVMGSSFSGNLVYAQNNTAQQMFGGAIYAGSTANITNSSFTGNQLNSSSNAGAALEGGAVFGSSVTVGTSNFNSNEIQFSGSPSQAATLFGGALFANTLTMTSSNVVGNSIQAATTAAQPYGGALGAFGGSISNSLLYLNTIAAQSSSSYVSLGGAVVLIGNVSGTVFVNNNATGARYNGGALFGYGTYTNDTFYGNGASAPASSLGGAMALSGTSYLYNDTIVGNGSSTVTVGGVFGASSSSTAVAYNTVISGNTGQSYVDEVYVTDKSNNYIDSSTTGVCTVNCTPMLSALGGYGGPTIGATGATQATLTMMPLPGSPLLAAGSTSYTGMPTTDARGYPRTTTYAGVAHEDIGAAEADYTLTFVQQPTRAPVNTNISPAPTVKLLESGVAFGGTGGVLGIGATAGTPSISSVATTASGLETLSVSFPMVEGSDTLIASVASAAATPVTVASTNSAAFNIYNYVLVFTTAPATPQTVGTANSVTVAIDGSDGYASTQTSPITLTVTGPNGYSQVYGPTTASASTGSATFATAALTTPGTYIYTASSSGFTSVATTQVVLTAQQAAPLVFVAGNGSVGSLDSIGSVSTTAVPGGGVGLGIDASGNAWSLGASGSLAKFNSGGALANTYSGLGLSGATALAIDGRSQVWVVNGNGSVTVLSNAGAVVSVTQGSTKAAGSGVAIDLSGNVWTSNGAAGTVDEVIGGAAPVAPLAVGVTGVSTGTEP